MKHKHVFLFGVWLTIALLIVFSVAPGLLLEADLRLYYYGGLCLGATITLIAAVLGDEASRT